MTRRAFDWVLIVALTGVWAVLFAGGVEDGLRTGRGSLRLGVSSAVDADVYPTLLWYAEWPALAPGDELVAVDGTDLRGSSALRFYDLATRSARERGHATVSARRNDSTSTFVEKLTLKRLPFWWTGLVFSAALMAAGWTLLVWAPGWHLTSRTFVASWSFASGFAVLDMYGVPAASAIQVILWRAFFAFGSALTVFNLQDFSPSTPPVPKLQRGLGVGAAALFLVAYLFRYHLPNTNALGDTLTLAASVGLAVAALFALTRTYWWSERLERRRLRWMVLGFYVGMLGVVVGSLVSMRTFLGGYFGADAPAVARVVQAILGLGMPLGLLASVIGYRWLDVDRLISATASYTVVGIVLLGAALALIPQAAGATAHALGVDPPVAQWLLTMALVLGAVPAHFYLWPRLDRQMFGARHRRMTGLDRLLDEVADCSSADELWELASERIGELLEPQSMVVYARDDKDVFAPRFARGHAPSQPYEESSLLVRALERRGRPVLADSAALDPFDRAALETLGVALVVPIRADENLLAFACLGRKRSGDIYTLEEIARLAALATRCAERVRRPDAARARENVFRHDGELWTIASRGKEIHLRDMRGLHYLAALLREPGREFAATDLAHMASRLASPHAGGLSELRVVHRLGDVGPILDAQAQAAYRERLVSLDEELADAERCADLGRHERATAEREALLAELESSHRRARPGSDSERARVAVTKAIKLALEKLCEAHPELGAHLTATIRRGYACSYEPDPRAPGDWEV